MIIPKVTLNKRIVILCLTSLTWIILYKFIFLGKEELFPKASETAEITFNLLSSVIASGIFYYFVVYLEQRRIAKIINPTLKRRIQTLGVGLLLIKNDIYKIKGLTPPEEIPELEMFKQDCEGIILSSSAPEISGNPSFYPTNWFEYFDYFFQSDKFLSMQLYAHVGFLTPNILRLLDEIQYSDFQRTLDMYRTHHYSDKLSDTAGPFWLYLNNLKELCLVAEKELT